MMTIPFGAGCMSAPFFVKKSTGPLASPAKKSSRPLLFPIIPSIPVGIQPLNIFNKKRAIY